uniref:Uncharacterized protein n=1 Tax=Anguilla anguilla TaxID=7936 RepID=A0A0E9WNA6_ANGAN
MQVKQTLTYRTHSKLHTRLRTHMHTHYQTLHRDHVRTRFFNTHRQPLTSLNQKMCTFVYKISFFFFSSNGLEVKVNKVLSIKITFGIFFFCIHSQISKFLNFKQITLLKLLSKSNLKDIAGSHFLTALHLFTLLGLEKPLSVSALGGSTLYMVLIVLYKSVQAKPKSYSFSLSGGLIKSPSSLS